MFAIDLLAIVGTLLLSLDILLKNLPFFVIIFSVLFFLRILFVPIFFLGCIWLVLFLKTKKRSFLLCFFLQIILAFVGKPLWLNQSVSFVEEKIIIFSIALVTIICIWVLWAKNTILQRNNCCFDCNLKTQSYERQIQTLYNLGLSFLYYILMRLWQLYFIRFSFTKHNIEFIVVVFLVIAVMHLLYSLDNLFEYIWKVLSLLFAIFGSWFALLFVFVSGSFFLQNRLVRTVLVGLAVLFLTWWGKLCLQ